MLELMLATVLSVMLMVGVLAVISRFGAAERAEAAASGQLRSRSTDTDAGTLEAVLDDRTIDRIVRLLRDDLKSAEMIEATRESRLSLSGAAAIDPASGERTHRPVQLEYQLESIGGQTWLIRRQAALDVLTNENVHRDLVCSGVSRFELTTDAGGAVRLRLWRGPSESSSPVERLVRVP